MITVFISMHAILFLIQNSVGDYTCDCIMGFTDPTCNTNIDECLENDCQNGAQCIVSLSKFTCILTSCMVVIYLNMHLYCRMKLVNTGVSVLLDTQEIYVIPALMTVLQIHAKITPPARYKNLCVCVCVW